ncbi:CENP-S associating centromere protein X-domain-containing protein [Aspergillus aurantiobrunneus]
MPPERQVPQKRRRLPFNPPSRASGSASASTTAGPSKVKPSKPPTKKTPKSNPTASSSKVRPNSRPVKPAKASSSRQRPSASPSNRGSATSSDSASDTRASREGTGSGSDSGSDDENEANYILAEITHREPENEDVLSSEPLIPPKLLTNLVHHNFRNEKTKIAKDANGVVAKYIDVFVREAVARAAFERAESAGGGLADGFLEVEDLEKMGPQLAMDF